MAKYVAIKDPLELLEKTLLWRHMAPTTPDTLCKFMVCYRRLSLILQGHFPSETRTLSFSPRARICTLQEIKLTLIPKAFQVSARARDRAC